MLCCLVHVYLCQGCYRHARDGDAHLFFGALSLTLISSYAVFVCAGGIAIGVVMMCRCFFFALEVFGVLALAVRSMAAMLLDWRWP